VGKIVVQHPYPKVNHFVPKCFAAYGTFTDGDVKTIEGRLTDPQGKQIVGKLKPIPGKPPVWIVSFKLHEYPAGTMFLLQVRSTDPKSDTPPVLVDGLVLIDARSKKKVEELIGPQILYPVQYQSVLPSFPSFGTGDADLMLMNAATMTRNDPPPGSQTVNPDTPDKKGWVVTFSNLANGSYRLEVVDQNNLKGVVDPVYVDPNATPG
jgi:hypothetical protein